MKNSESDVFLIFKKKKKKQIVPSEILEQQLNLNQILGAKIYLDT